MLNLWVAVLFLTSDVGRGGTAQAICNKPLANCILCCDICHGEVVPLPIIPQERSRIRAYVVYCVYATCAHQTLVLHAPL